MKIAPDIDPAELIALQDAHAKYFPMLHRNVLYRWSKRGCRGVKLPTTRIGCKLFTTTAAVNWFKRQTNKVAV